MSAQSLGALRTGIDVTLDRSSRLTSESAKLDAEINPPSAVGIQAIDVSYSALKPHLQRSQTAFNSTNPPKCAICRTGTPPNGAATLLCINENCNAASHLQCLSAAFLQAEIAKSEVMIPTSGHCPKCGELNTWVDLVKDLSMRMRGEKEIKALFKPKRTNKDAKAAAPMDDEESSSDEDDPLDMVLDEEEGEVWHDLFDSSDEGESPKRIRSDPSPAHKSAALRHPETPRSEPVIHDSEWDEADLLT